MATLASGGRISLELVDEETERLKALWSGPENPESDSLEGLLGDRQLAELDLFDRIQLAHVVEVCRRCRSLSEAGRTLFGASRGRKSSSNDADRLRKYLKRFNLDWSQLN